ncbi:MAG TPA: glycosyl transferase [Lachnospiraceae bacterium]|nr:glycosyl transferase [Lachnospiraceae bacterium]
MFVWKNRGSIHRTAQEMMRILMINVVCGIKSTGRICTDLADILQQHGNEVKIAYGREDVPEQYADKAFLISKGISTQMHALKTRLFDMTGFGSKYSTEKFIEWIELYDPDIIHMHNLHGYYINIELLFNYLKRSNRRVVWTLHDCWSFTGHCAHYAYEGCIQWKSQCSKCNLMREYPKCVLWGNVKRNYNKKKELFTGVKGMQLVTPSAWLGEQVAQSFLKEYACTVIPNGVDLERFKKVNSNFREKYNLTNKIIVLGVATAWSEKKGLYKFCDIAETLGEQYKVVLVGVNSQQEKALPETIIKIRKTNSIEELSEIYSAADVFLNLSKEETMGLTTVEAMACGTPVVTTDLTAVPEVVDSDSGIVVHDYSTDSFVDGITRVLRGTFEPRIRAEMYDKELQYQKYIELYEKLIQNS